MNIGKYKVEIPSICSERGDCSTYGLFLDLFWSDPDPRGRKGCRKNDDRNIACFFGPDVTEEFLKKYNLSMIIRSHQVKQEGYDFSHNGKVLTIFSASNYSGGSNWGAIVRWLVKTRNTQ